MFIKHIFVCINQRDENAVRCSCGEENGAEIVARFKELIQSHKLKMKVRAQRASCFDICEQGPIMVIYPEGVFYAQIKSKDVKSICDEHLYKGRIVEKLVFDEALTPEKEVKAFDEIKFYSKQTRVALRNCGLINPDDIEEYIARDGYRGLGKVLLEMTPSEAKNELVKGMFTGFADIKLKN